MADIKVAMISSTVRDLPDHREKVRDACLRQSVQPSMMEHWPSIDADGITASLAKVDQADIYIGVFAHRYGYVPKGHKISVTEMEYNRAVERGIPRLIFIMDEDHPVTISQVEIEAAHNLTTFKQRLKTERVVSFFKSPEHLATAVVQSLSSLETPKSATAEDSAKLRAASASPFDPRNYVFFVPYRPKGNQVVGRDSALKAVRTQLLSGHRTAIGQTASFQGLGGLGKSQLAVEYAYVFKDQYPNGVIWLNADQDIEAQLTKVAERARWVAGEADHKDKLAIARQRLKTHSHCLLIFDNVENADAIKEYLPEPEAEPHILVTSRADQPNFVPVPLDLLDSNFSLQLLSQESGLTPVSEAEKSAAQNIAEKLGGLPLALELAGAYLRHRPIGWVRYSELLSQNLKAALPSKLLKASFTRHESDLYSTLKVNEDVLCEEPLLRDILDLLTWSGASPMGQDLLCIILGINDSSSAAGALALGVSLRLLQKTPGVESYTLHRLVREVRREDIPLAERKEWALKIADRLGGWFQRLKRNFSDLPTYESEIEHLRAWQQNIHEFAPILASRLVWLQAYPPFHRGHYQVSHSLLEEARRLICPPHKEDLELKANLLTDLCTINGFLGNYSPGRECGEEAVAIRVKLFGENHSDTAMSIHNLGAILRMMGKNEESLTHHQKAVSIWRELHGENHIDTALALDGVGNSYRSLGKNDEALTFVEQALLIREKVLGTQHPDTAMSLSNVANVCTAIGNYARARECEERAIAILTELFGAKSSLMATALRNVAFTCYRQKDLKKALEISCEVLAMRKELFGDQHPETIASVADVASLHFDLGHNHLGFQLLDEYLKKIKKGHSHYDFLKNKKRGFEARIVRPGFRQRPRS